MKKSIILIVILQLIASSLIAKSIDLSIADARTANDIFKMEIELKRTDSWDDLGLGNSDFIFTKNSEAFSGTPWLENLNSNLVDNENYEINISNLQDKIIIGIEYSQNGGYDWFLSLNQKECLGTFNWIIENHNSYSEIEWQSSTTLWTTDLFDIIEPTFYGSGNIQLLAADNENNSYQKDIIKIHPNPFGTYTDNASLTIITPETGNLKLKVYNVKGQYISQLIDDFYHKEDIVNCNWKGTDNNGKILSSGIYLFQLSLDGKNFATKKILILR